MEMVMGMGKPIGTLIIDTPISAVVESRYVWFTRTLVLIWRFIGLFSRIEALINGNKSAANANSKSFVTYFGAFIFVRKYICFGYGCKIDTKVRFWIDTGIGLSIAVSTERSRTASFLLIKLKKITEKRLMSRTFFLTLWFLFLDLLPMLWKWADRARGPPYFNP